MPGISITCPYCFETFDDKDVHFRMETVFKEEELDPENDGRSREEIEALTFSGRSEDEVEELLRQYDLRAKFQAGIDPVYLEWWKSFGDTTEKSSEAKDGRTKQINPYERPVYSPSNNAHNAYFSKIADKKMIVNNGMLIGAVDCFGKETRRRVCPVCHNPLPGYGYGLHPVKFIPVIGVTGAGKTVYLSQVCKYMKRDLSKYSISCNTTSDYATEYVNRFKVEMGVELPEQTAPEQLMQPLCYDIKYIDSNNQSHSHTLVFYDIAGENCVKAQKMLEWGNFILHSDAIILIIDPKQFKAGMDASAKQLEPTKVLEAIHNLFSAEDASKFDHPLAVCISKGDHYARDIIQMDLSDIVEKRDSDGNYLPEFNAEDYNKIHDGIEKFLLRLPDNSLNTELKTNYHNYNYFLFSALGCDVEDLADGKSSPISIPVPRRIMEPLLWILVESNYISAADSIHEPTDWNCCGQRIKRETKFCPVCHKNINGTKWYCVRDKIEVEIDKEGDKSIPRYCPKCKMNPEGKKKPLFKFGR